jgi:hypothetical protein
MDCNQKGCERDPPERGMTELREAGSEKDARQSGECEVKAA